MALKIKTFLIRILFEIKILHSQLRFQINDFTFRIYSNYLEFFNVFKFVYFSFLEHYKIQFFFTKMLYSEISKLQFCHIIFSFITKGFKNLFFLFIFVK